MIATPMPNSSNINCSQRMMDTMKMGPTRQVRLDDFLADVFEREADKLPPSYREIAEIYRKRADAYRKSKSREMILIREDLPTGSD